MANKKIVPELLMRKSEAAYLESITLLNAGYPDGAANRAYYAMFDAARAALLVLRTPVRADIGKTHSGLINAFGEYLEKAGIVPSGLSKKINRALRLRQIADYTGDFLEMEQAVEIVDNAKEFIRDIKYTLSTDFQKLEESSQRVSRNREKL